MPPLIQSPNDLAAIMAVPASGDQSETPTDDDTDDVQNETGDLEAQPETEAQDTDQDLDTDSSEDDEGDGPESDELDDDEDVDVDEDDEIDELQVSADTVITFEFEGKTYTATPAELQRGNFRQSDYSRKTAEIARERETIRQEAETVAKLRADYAQRLEAFDLRPPPAPDWQQLAAEDPAKFNAAFARWQAQNQEFEQLKAKRAEELQRVTDEQAEYQKKYLEQQRAALIELVPRWSDPKVAEAEMRVLGNKAMALFKLTPDEYGQIAQAKHIEILRWAVKGKEAESRNMKLVRKARQVGKGNGKAKAGKKPSGRPPKVDSRAARNKARREKAKATGKIEDFAAAMNIG